ncbi:hypothetical protein [Brevundimonas sp.]|uniref:hypothetical protein n=1 Tax=Brevundimonas sp. TaxID=1871086 RepID=UPI001D7FF1AC|nr:hypothetical protein [Brevundimonas sp.]MBA3999024.1 hypothetical protein [Brevundimonas sp.]
MDHHNDDDDVWEGFRLTGVAVVSAFIVAALVIGAGGAVLPALLDEPDAPAPVVRASINR